MSSRSGRLSILLCVGLLATAAPGGDAGGTLESALRAEPQAVSLVAVPGKAAPSGTVQLTDDQGGPVPELSMSIDYRDGQVDDWLSATLERRGDDTVTVLAAPETFGMPAGLYEASVVVNEGESLGQGAVIAVTLRVAEPWPQASRASRHRTENQSRSSS